MIKTILQFLNGSIHKVNQTNRTIILSDGSKHNAKLFHQNLNIIRQFVQLELQKSDVHEEILKSILESRNALVLKHTQEIEKMNRDYDRKYNALRLAHDHSFKTLADSNADLNALVALLPTKWYLCNKVIHFGQYKGSTYAEIYKTHPKYLEWLSKQNWFIIPK